MPADIELRPSELRKFLDCERKWAFERKELGGIESVSSKAQLFGTALHKLQEDWLLEGKEHPDTPMGRLAKLSVPFLPEPGAEGLKVEKRVFVKGGDGWVFAGTPDVRVSVPGRDPSFLFDHKTTGNHKYALSAAALAGDTQLIVYGSATLAESGASTLVARWLYSLKGKDDPRPDDLMVREIVVPAHKMAIRLTMLRMTGQTAFEAVRDRREPLSMTPNKSMCKAYGGCPFRERCGIPMTDYEKERMKTKMATDKMTAVLAEKRKRLDEEKAFVAAGKAVTPGLEKYYEEAPVIEEPENVAVTESSADGAARFAINPPDAAEPIAELPLEPMKEKKAKKQKKEAAALKPVAVEAKDAGLRVFVGCRRSKGEGSHTDFREFVAAAEKTVNDAFGVEDYRLVEYGKGQGALVAALKKEVAGLTGDISVDLDSPSQRLCFDALCAIATEIYEGVR